MWSNKSSSAIRNPTPFETPSFFSLELDWIKQNQVSPLAAAFHYHIEDNPKAAVGRDCGYEGSKNKIYIKYSIGNAREVIKINYPLLFFDGLISACFR